MLEFSQQHLFTNCSLPDLSLFLSKDREWKEEGKRVIFFPNYYSKRSQNVKCLKFRRRVWIFLTNCLPCLCLPPISPPAPCSLLDSPGLSYYYPLSPVSLTRSVPLHRVWPCCQAQDIWFRSFVNISRIKWLKNVKNNFNILYNTFIHFLMQESAPAGAGCPGPK